ncbi:SusE domain-containing protein [Rufibacter quisquiliarum]|nr:SusE domain-containing protein [Rufibacter quisquiliarum]
MKTNYTKLLMLTLFSMILWSCDKDEDMIILKDGTEATLSASQTNLILKEEDKAKDAVTFSWTKSDFGYDAAVTYSLEFGKKGENFAKPEVIEVGNVMMKTMKVSDLNMVANKIGMKGFEEGEMEVRVKASVGASVASVYSAVTTLAVTPYLAEPEYPVIYLVGAAAENDWNNSKATPFFRDETDPFVYTLTSKLKAGDFKLLGMLGKWGPAWGMDAKINATSATIKFRPKESDPDVPNFTGLIPADGYYTITVSLRNNTLTVEPYGAGAGAPTYNSIGILGEFNGWGNDVMMTNSTFNPHLWYGEVTLPAKADPKALSELKFRVDKDWGTNWGAGADQTLWYGKGTPGSPNLKMQPGTYKVQFNDLTGNYVLVKQK